MVQPWQIQELARHITEEFSPDRIVLFGSFAYGVPTEDSDVDLLAIMPFEGKAYRKASEIANIVRSRFPIDILVRDPLDVARRYEEVCFPEHYKQILSVAFFLILESDSSYVFFSNPI